MANTSMKRRNAESAMFVGIVQAMDQDVATHMQRRGTLARGVAVVRVNLAVWSVECVRCAQETQCQTSIV